MSSRNILLTIVAVVLLLVSSMGRQGAPDPSPSPEPPPSGEGSATAISMRNAYRGATSVAARKHADRIEAMEFQDEAAEMKAWAEVAGKVAKDSTSASGPGAGFQAMYAKVRAMKADDAVKAKARADWFRSFAAGMEAR
ncbi:hypothetical protein [Planctomyces sp. SH-PL14]|uniref:hypothetical protein n=1 Tax=Planctomyces sp. SH-PL14 TaxID=1632864 RepID=UPI00078B182B|nr:hypothetical protein [Planctomyces sp. SH-PL14]AMV20429.1 hypothetical protein VT03_21200 [Planctomyces sp. SH-PL14]